MLKINYQISIEDFKEKLDRFWQISGNKIQSIEDNFDHSQGAPVITEKGKYIAQGWTEWTQGFQYGSSILQFDATGDDRFLEIGRQGTINRMAGHISHMGVHDHGFNNLSTYGNLLRLIKEGKIPENEWEKNFYELAIKISGAVQASRWTPIKNGGFIYSFNGPHSLFVDTIRSTRILLASHKLGHSLHGENDIRISLLDRAMQHARATASYSVYYGEERDNYDIIGRTAHECIFNINDGNFRAPNSLQGFTGRSTWTRGLAWAITGFSELLEFVDYCDDDELLKCGGRQEIEYFMLRAVRAVCDFYIENTPIDGIPYWDTGAPGLVNIKDYLNKEADPFNAFEPVDSSAAVIAAQGLIRLGKYYEENGDTEQGSKYLQAGLTVFETLLNNTYLSESEEHQGLILHAIYHHPNGWDYKPEVGKVPYGESSMWGDYHARELAIYLQKMILDEPYYTFFNCVK